MLDKFNKLVSSVIFESSDMKNSFDNEKDILEQISKNGYESFKEFREDKNLVRKIKLSGKKIIEKTCELIYNEMDLLDEDSKEDKKQFDFLNQLFFFLKEKC